MTYGSLTLLENKHSPVSLAIALVKLQYYV